MKTLVRVVGGQFRVEGEGYIESTVYIGHGDINAVIIIDGRIHVVRLDHLKVIQPKEIVTAVRESIKKVLKEVYPDATEADMDAMFFKFNEEPAEVYASIYEGVVNGFSIGSLLSSIEDDVRKSLNESV